MKKNLKLKKRIKAYHKNVEAKLSLIAMMKAVPSDEIPTHLANVATTELENVKRTSRIEAEIFEAVHKVFPEIVPASRIEKLNQYIEQLNSITIKKKSDVIRYYETAVIISLEIAKGYQEILPS